MTDIVEEIRCALAMRDAGYQALLGHEATAELLRRYDGLVKALTLFLATDETMEGILWGSEPDTALVKITIPLGQYREARATLSQAKGAVGTGKQP